MAKLIYIANMSLDGYVADKNGKFEWGNPDEEQFIFITELLRPVGTYLYGRRMYEVMSVWQSMATLDLAAMEGLPAFARRNPSVFLDFANVWCGAEKVVYSRTLKAAPTPKTHIEQGFEIESVQRMKAAAAGDLTIGGPTLAAQAFSAGLVDDCHLFVAPIIVGEGNSAFPSGIRHKLALQDERRFRNGIVHLHYRSTTNQGA